MQRQPSTVLEALLPSPAKVGGGTLLPVTLGGITLLHKLHSPFVEDGATAVELEVFVAGHVLSLPWSEAFTCLCAGELPAQSIAWAERCGLSCDVLVPAIKSVLAAGFSPAADTKWPEPDGAMVEEESQYGNGMGYLLTMTDALCNAYGWPLHTALNTPLATAFALLVARRITTGADWMEPNYFERDVDFDKLKESIDAALLPHFKRN